MSEPRRIDLSKVKRQPKQQETRAFSDPLAPGVELKVTLEFPVYYHEKGDIATRAQELCEWWRDPETRITRLEPVDGVQTTLSDADAVDFATLEKMQPQPPLYDFRDFNEMGVKMPSALAALCEWARSLLPNEDGVKRGRIVTSAASTSSSSPSTPPTSTPRLPNNANGSSGASTSGSAPSAGDLEAKLQAELDESVMSPTGTG